MKLSALINKKFDEVALNVFKHQANNNTVYQQFVDFLKIDSNKINAVAEIPLLPVDFFKTHKVVNSQREIEKIFLSSGTSLQNRSHHHVADLKLYEESFTKGFNHFYGEISDYCILALLPSYIENGDSSLIYMVDKLIALSKKNGSQYLLGKEQEIHDFLLKQQKSNTKTIVIGVTYALLDLAENFPADYSNIIFMETGGMKGKRKEITREELHQTLKIAFNVNSIHSEYGMSELLSQAYSKGNGIFECPPWMKVQTRPMHEPFGKCNFGETGIVQIIDLANYYSCSFIETADLGKVYENGTFEILGRLDYSEIRGCNLLIQ